jgi:hypothetical protein
MLPRIAGIIWRGAATFAEGLLTLLRLARTFTYNPSESVAPCYSSELARFQKKKSEHPHGIHRVQDPRYLTLNV